jgi:hypothetical protein
VYVYARHSREGKRYIDLGKNLERHWRNQKKPIASHRWTAGSEPGGSASGCGLLIDGVKGNSLNGFAVKAVAM